MSEYPDRMTLRPIDRWPLEPTRNRKRSQFGSTLSRTLEQLTTELRHLGGGRRLAPSVLQISLREQDFRKSDGLPMSRAVASHPGVILNIESQHGPLSYPCDTFSHWHDNLRAITLGLESLRRVERYGITQTGQQYRGWLALESAPSMTTLEAERFLREYAGAHINEVSTMRNVLRRARSKAHPDRNNGDQSQWDRVETSAKVLGIQSASPEQR